MSWLNKNGVFINNFCYFLFPQVIQLSFLKLKLWTQNLIYSSDRNPTTEKRKILFSKYLQTCRKLSICSKTSCFIKYPQPCYLSNMLKRAVVLQRRTSTASFPNSGSKRCTIFSQIFSTIDILFEKFNEVKIQSTLFQCERSLSLKEN